MKPKNYELILDTESSINSNLVDLGCVLTCNSRVIDTKSFLVSPFYLNEELFYNRDKKGAFSKAMLEGKHAFYKQQIDGGKTIIVSVTYIQRYFDKIISLYPNCTMLAYNSDYDINLMKKSGLDTTAFNVKCLWQLALSTVCRNKKYAKFCVQNELLTPAGCLSTSCDSVLLFLAEQVKGFKEYAKLHDHTAYNDALAEHYLYLYLKRLKLRAPLKPFNYREWKLKEHI